MITETKEAQQFMLQGEYVNGDTYRTIETKVAEALKQERPIIIDVSRAARGVQTEFWGYFWGTIRAHYKEKELPLKIPNIKIIFSDRYSRAFNHFKELHIDDFFEIEFTQIL